MLATIHATPSLMASLESHHHSTFHSVEGLLCSLTTIDCYASTQASKLRTWC